MKLFKKMREDARGEITVGKLVMMAIFVVIGLALAPTVNQFAVDAAANMTGAAASLVPLTSLFYVLGIIIGSIGMVIYAAKGE